MTADPALNKVAHAEAGTHLGATLDLGTACVRMSDLEVLFRPPFVALALAAVCWYLCMRLVLWLGSRGAPIDAILYAGWIWLISESWGTAEDPFVPSSVGLFVCNLAATSLGLLFCSASPATSPIPLVGVAAAAAAYTA
jgi:hypothetical protein